MSTFVHKGIEITLGDNGLFRATINGKTVTKTSLDAMKKSIDGNSKFVPIPALRVQGYEPPLEVTVTGVTKNAPRHRGQQLFEITWRNEGAAFMQDRSEYVTEITPNTPEAKAAIAKWQETSKRNEAEIDRLRKESMEAWHAVPRLRSSDYKPEGDK